MTVPCSSYLLLLLLLLIVILQQCSTTLAWLPPNHNANVQLDRNHIVGLWKIHLELQQAQHWQLASPCPNPSERYKQSLSQEEDMYNDHKVIVRLNDDGTFHLEECETNPGSALCNGGIWDYQEPHLLLAANDQSPLLLRGQLQVCLETSQLDVPQGQILEGTLQTHQEPIDLLQHGPCTSRRGVFGMQQLAVEKQDEVVEAAAQDILNSQLAAAQDLDKPTPEQQPNSEEESASGPTVLGISGRQEEKQAASEGIEQLTMAFMTGEMDVVDYLDAMAAVLGGDDHVASPDDPEVTTPHIPNIKPPFANADFYNKTFSLAATEFPIQTEKHMEDQYRFYHLDPTLGLGVHSLDMTFFPNNTFAAVTTTMDNESHPDGTDSPCVIRGEFGITGDDHDYLWCQVTGRKTPNKRGYIGHITTYFAGTKDNKPVYSVYGNYYNVAKLQMAGDEQSEGTFVLQQVREQAADIVHTNYADLFSWDFKEIFETPWEEWDQDAFQ